MTIFHILKYQLSDPPTMEEFQAIPDILYGIVIHPVSLNYFEYRYSPHHLSSILRNMKSYSRKIYTECMSDIQQKLYEYDGTEV